MGRYEMIKAGQMRFDENNGRWIVPESTGCDPKCWSCLVYELGETGDLELDGRYLFQEHELRHFKVI